MDQTIAADNHAQSYELWQVRARNSTGYSGWTSLRAFITNETGRSCPDAAQMLRIGGAQPSYRADQPPSSNSQAYTVYYQGATGGTVSAGTAVILQCYGKFS